MVRFMIWFMVRFMVGFMIRIMMRCVNRFAMENIWNISVVWLMSWIWFRCEVLGEIMFRLRSVVGCRWVIAWCNRLMVARFRLMFFWSMVCSITLSERSK